MKKVQRVVAVVDENDAFSVESDGETEKSTGARATGIDVLNRDLGTTGGRFYNVAVPSVDRQNVAIGSDGHTKRLVQVSAHGDCVTRPGAGEAEDCVRNRGNAV